jgi:hypothetical protein
MIVIRVHNDFQTAAEVYPWLQYLTALYPDQEKWWWQSIVPSVLRHENFILRAETVKGELAGFAVVKDTFAEKKILCLRVLPQFSRQHSPVIC